MFLRGEPAAFAPAVPRVKIVCKSMNTSCNCFDFESIHLSFSVFSIQSLPDERTGRQIQSMERRTPFRQR